MQKYIFEIPNHDPAHAADTISKAKLLQAPKKLSFAQAAASLLVELTEQLSKNRDPSSSAPRPRSWTTSGPTERLAARSTGSPAAGAHSSTVPNIPDTFMVTASFAAVSASEGPKAETTIVELKIELNPEMAIEHKKYAELLCEDARRLIHDLAQPVQAIYSFGASLVNAVYKDETAYPPKQANWIRISNEQTERLVNLIKEHRANYISPTAFNAPCRPCWALAVLLAEFESRRMGKGGTLLYHPLPDSCLVNVDLQKLLTCTAIYLSILEESASEMNEKVTFDFGFLANPEPTDVDPGKIYFGFTFPVSEQTRSNWQHPTFDPKRRDFGFGYLSLLRGLEELGAIRPKYQGSNNGPTPEFIGVLLSLQAQA
jgi:hypothetical protein